MTTRKGVVLFVFITICGFASSNIFADELGCPDGYYEDFGNVCIDLSFDRPVVMAPEDDNTCLRGFEKMAGVNHCLANNIRLDILDRHFILTDLPTDYCPEEFSRPPGHSICAADNLVLNVVSDALSLEQSPNICDVDPEACQGPPDAGVHLFWAVLECPEGFLKPPGVHFCMAENLVLADLEPADLPIPVGKCPEYWSRAKNSNFCTPINTIQLCEDRGNCDSGFGELIKIIAKPVDCPPGMVTHFSIAPQSNQSQSAQGIGGFTAIPVWLCAPPDAGVHLNF